MADVEAATRVGVSRTFEDEESYNRWGMASLDKLRTATITHESAIFKGNSCVDEQGEIYGMEYVA